MAISTNPKPTLYCNLWENTGPDPIAFVLLGSYNYLLFEAGFNLNKIFACRDLVNQMIQFGRYLLLINGIRLLKFEYYYTSP